MGCCTSKKSIKSKKNDSKLSILYLEDVELHYELVNLVTTNYLLNYNVNLYWAKSLDSAYRYIKENKVDIVIIDRMIGDQLLGEDFIDILIREKLINITKIIILTGYKIDKKCQEFIDKGVSYLTKPIDVKDMLRVITHILN